MLQDAVGFGGVVQCGGVPTCPGGHFGSGGTVFKIRLPQLSIIANQPTEAEYPTKAL